MLKKSEFFNMIKERDELRYNLQTQNELSKLKNPSADKLIKVLEDLGMRGYNLQHAITFYKNTPIFTNYFGVKYFLDKKDNLIIKRDLEEVITYLNEEIK